MIETLKRALARTHRGKRDGGGNHVGGRRSGSRVHPHIERLVALKAEAAALGIELQRRHAEVGERAVNGGDTARVEHLRKRPVVGVRELDPIAPRRERVACARQRLRIAIESDQPGGATGENLRGMAAEPDRTIEEDSATPGSEIAQHFVAQDGDVRDQMPNSDSARASSSV